jgi:hypothetical protein
MPFALNDATRHISPAKTLEYMAAGKPIVSTPVADVAEPYAALVRIGDGAAQFLAACEDALAEAGEPRERRAREMRELAEDLCWDDTAAAMEAIVFGARPRLGEPPLEQDQATIVLDAAGDVVVAGDASERVNGVRVLGIEAPARRLRLAEGLALRYDTLYANVPLPRLVDLLGRHAPQGVRDAATRLRAPASSGAAANVDADARFARQVVRIHHWLATVDIRPVMPSDERGTTEAERAMPTQRARA